MITPQQPVSVQVFLNISPVLIFPVENRNIQSMMRRLLSFFYYSGTMNAARPRRDAPWRIDD